MGLKGDFLRDGWLRFSSDPQILNWARQARPVAIQAATDPTHKQHWLRAGGTWFAGVNVLPNGPQGQLGAGPALCGAAVEFIKDCLGLAVFPLDAGQVSITYPGYPRRDRDESAASFRYRQNRDAAHLDGLLPIGPARRRMIREPHGFILGLPVTDADAGAAPLVVWQGSHQVIGTCLRRALAARPVAEWSDTDVTDAYHAARRQVFETCPRVLVPAVPGQATVLHRLLLHGVAPWQTGARAAPEGRAIVYFRPQLSGGVGDWLSLP